MQEYAQLPFRQSMAFLIKALDGDVSSIHTPTLPPLSSKIDPSLLISATQFLKRTGLPILPRKQWVSGGLTHYQLKGGIPEALQSQQGMALSTYDDAGWGQLVKRGKYQDKHFSDELVQACVTLINRWNPDIQWVTCVPSLQHPNLVPDFAQRLAKALTLPFYQTLSKTESRPQQKTMANSAQQAKNVDGSINTINKIPSGNVLLVDDMVDSRWTITVCAWLLRSHGCGLVFPLALSDTGHSDES